MGTVPTGICLWRKCTGPKRGWQQQPPDVACKDADLESWTFEVPIRGGSARVLRRSSSSALPFPQRRSTLVCRFTCRTVLFGASAWTLRVLGALVLLNTCLAPGDDPLTGDIQAARGRSAIASCDTCPAHRHGREQQDHNHRVRRWRLWYAHQSPRHHGYGLMASRKELNHPAAGAKPMDIRVSRHAPWS